VPGQAGRDLESVVLPQPYVDEGGVRSRLHREAEGLGGATGLAADDKAATEQQVTQDRPDDGDVIDQEDTGAHRSIIDGSRRVVHRTDA
jgi:hypothetical protein